MRYDDLLVSYCMSNAKTRAEKEMRDPVVTVLREPKSDDHDTLRA